MKQKVPASPDSANLFQTIPSHAEALSAPRYVPEIALIIHSLADPGGRSVQRSRVATIHRIENQRGKCVLQAGRLLDRAEELSVAHDLTTAEQERPSLEFLPAGILHHDPHSATWLLPAGVRPMRFRTPKGTKTWTVPWPPLVCHGRGADLFVVALSTTGHPALTLRTYNAPLANVYANTRLCLGNIAAPIGGALANVAEWTRILIDTAFSNANHDEAIAQDVAMERFWAGLNGASEFPLKALVARKQTLASWLAARAGNREGTDVE